jgi:hypothetical protein
MLRFRRLGPLVVLALVTAAFLAPAAHAGRALAGGQNDPTTGPTAATGTPRAGAGGVDWNIALAGAAGSAVVIGTCAGALRLARRFGLTG